MSEFKMDFDNNKEAQELADLSKELYNKDLRPIVVKKAPKKEKVAQVPEGIVQEPVKVDKVEEQVQAMKKVVQAHDTLVEEIAKVAPQDTTVQVEAVVEAVKPTKKKRKYYPKKK